MADSETLETLKAIVGEDIADSTLRALLLRAGGDVAAAANSFFDGGEFCCRFLEEKHGGPACSRQSIAQSFCDESNIFGEFTVNLKALWQWMDHDEERRKKGPKMTLWQAKQLREWVGNDSSPDSLDKFLATC